MDVNKLQEFHCCEYYCSLENNNSGFNLIHGERRKYVAHFMIISTTVKMTALAVIGILINNVLSNVLKIINFSMDHSDK